MTEVDLHEAAQAEDGVVETAVCQVLLSARLHLHQRHLRVFVTVVNREEHVSLDTHCLQGRACCDVATHAMSKHQLLRQRRPSCAAGDFRHVKLFRICEKVWRAWRCM